jgi:hypothetical protein
VNRNFTDDEVHAIRADPRSNRAVASVYGVSPASISFLRVGFTYRDVPVREDALMRRGADRKSFAEIAYLEIGGSCLIPGATAHKDGGSVRQWTRKTGFKVKLKTTNHGLRVWRIA